MCICGICGYAKNGAWPSLVGTDARIITAAESQYSGLLLVQIEENFTTRASHTVMMVASTETSTMSLNALPSEQAEVAHVQP